MAQSTRRKRKSALKKRRQAVSPIAILLPVLAALALSLFFLFRVLPRHDDFSPAAETAVSESTPAPAPTLPPTDLAAACFGLENGYKTYHSDSITSTLGIDVSSHQGRIDWQAVSDNDIDYAIIRAGYRGYTDGKINQDEYFEYNMESTAALGMNTGVYFFSQALTEEEAIEEANWVLELVSGYTLTHPIYFDWEMIADSNARTASIRGSELTRCALAFCRTIENAGYEAGIYFNLSISEQLYHLYDLKDYDFWLAEYQDVPTYPYRIDMWQYTETGSVPGIATDVDLNLRFR